MFEDLFERMKSLAVSSQSLGLFAAFHDDLYKHDLDIVMNDLKCGDRFLWIIKEYGTYLTLVCPDNEFLQAVLDSVKRDGMKRRYFIISVMQDRCDIAEVPVLGLHDVVKSLPYIKNRVPNRRFASSLLYEAFPSVKGSIMMSDHSLELGAELYLSVTANSLTYVTTVTNKSRTIGLPFDANRASGYLKLTVTTEFGHGELVPITARVFNNAVKKQLNALLKAARLSESKEGQPQMFSQKFLSVLGANIRVPNQILSPANKNFYVSFNDTDTGIYGDVTTALVIGQMEQFLILNGDHRKAYAELAEKDADLDAYIAYFNESGSHINKLSDAPPAATLH